MNQNAQGAIEYLLIIGAAILIVAVVVIALTGVTGTATQATGDDDVQNALSPLQIEQRTYSGQKQLISTGTTINLSQEGKTYFLNSNLISSTPNSDAIKITANNITLDCAGFTIINNGEDTDQTPDDTDFHDGPRDARGIVIDANNVTIKDCKINSPNGYGVHVYVNKIGIFFDNVTLLHAGTHGFVFYENTHITIKDSDFCSLNPTEIENHCRSSATVINQGNVIIADYQNDAECDPTPSMEICN